MTISSVEILKQAELACGSLSALARRTEIERSVLKRIKNGTTKTPHADTIAKLVRASRGK